MSMINITTIFTPPNVSVVNQLQILVVHLGLCQLEIHHINDSFLSVTNCGPEAMAKSLIVDMSFLENHQRHPDTG
jgi:hypothetical protein